MSEFHDRGRRKTHFKCSQIERLESRRLLSAGPLQPLPGELAGVVYDDRNADHVRQAGEPGLVGVRVYLDANRNGALDDGERSTLTDAAARYRFTGVAPGGYVVAQEAPTGYRQLVPTAGYGQHAYVYAGKATTVAPFADHRNIGALSGFIYNDLNRSGQRSPGEPGLAGVRVSASQTDLGWYSATTLTDASGHYAFRGLAPGTYVISAQPPAGGRVIGPIYRSITRTLHDYEIAGNNFGIQLHAPGAANPAFGDHGVVNGINFSVEPYPYAGITDSGSAMAVAPDGAVVAAGPQYTSLLRGYDFGLYRITPGGKFDTSFGDHGNVVTHVGPDQSIPRAILTQKDGRIIAVGSSPVDRWEFTLARYLPNGALDPSFGSKGIAQTAVGPFDALATAAALQPDGKIIVAGASSAVGGFSQFQFTVVRYRSDGTLDPTFGVGGIVVTPLFQSDDEATAVAIQPDGKIVVAGGVAGPADMFARRFGLARYTADGKLDTTFGTGGTVVTDTGAVAQAIALDRAGRILVAGGATLARYDSAGRLDPSFGIGGETSLDFLARTIALQANGKIVLGGTRFVPISKGPDEPIAAVERFTPAGAIDPSFVFLPQDLPAYPGTTVTSVAIAPDGDILALTDQSVIKLIGDAVPTVSRRG
jgi:uncharacterized delta-60 repeat protein